MFSHQSIQWKVQFLPIHQVKIEILIKQELFWNKIKLFFLFNVHVILHGMRVVKTEKMLFWKQIWISVLLDNVTKKPLKHKQNTPLFTAKQTYSVQGSSNLDVPCKEFLLTSLSRLIQISMQSFITMLLLWSFKFQFWQVFLFRKNSFAEIML